MIPDLIGLPRSLVEEAHALCQTGILRVRKGEYDAIEFSLFNAVEVDAVRAYMRENAPDIPYSCKWTAGTPTEPSFQP